MKLLVKIININSIPKIKKLKEIMWPGSSSFSRVGRDHHLKKGVEIALAWDKWIDDPRWSGHIKSKEYLYFQFIKPDTFNIEIEDDAIFVDKRAAYLVAAYLASKNNSSVRVDEDNWYTADKFVELSQEYSKCSFEEAVTISLGE